jgi:hypothetical protein
MTGLETNVFPVVNLHALSSTYRLYHIRGLTRDQSEFHQNCQTLTRDLSYKLQAPVMVVEHEGAPHLAVYGEMVEPPSPFLLVRTGVRFERIPGVFTLDYSVRSRENDELCLRFLQFMLQAPLHRRPDLWQPQPGQPFFGKTPAGVVGDAARYAGFSVRVMVTADGGLGVCVDATSKYVGRNGLPTHIARDNFSQLKNRHYIYRYGHTWYQIQVTGLSDLNVSEYLISDDGGFVSLLAFVTARCVRPIPIELAQLPHDSAVLLYKNNRGEDRAAPSALCYPVHSTHDEGLGGQHGGRTLAPTQRRQLIAGFVNRYLSQLRFGSMQVVVSKTPVSALPRMFVVPDLMFGHSRVLSVRGTPGAQHVGLDALGRARLALIKDKTTGFYCQDPFDRQYLVLPQSVFDSFGQRLLADLRAAVDSFSPPSPGYQPVIVTYDDRGPRTFSHQGNAILRAIQEKCQRPGYGVVMIHHTSDRPGGAEDELAAMVIGELRKSDVCVSVIHSTVPQECYELRSSSDGELRYKPIGSKLGKLNGYLRNVALTKVYLTNQCWPFVLHTPLNADITIGIDVKQNTAGFLIVGKNGGEIRALLKTSRQKEHLFEDQTAAYLVEILRAESTASSLPILTIVIHRDGRIFRSEINGVHRAIGILKQEGVLNSEATVTIVEIPKTSPVHLRLFDTTGTGGAPDVQNPEVGAYHIVDTRDGYLCSTGRAFPRRGTVRPLHVRRIEGPLSIEQCLEDVYYLTVLAWTRPEDCTRYPITIKLNDRFLGEEAGDYDTAALDIEATLEDADEEAVL